MILQFYSPEGSYDIIAERGCLSRFGELCDTDRKILVVTDSGVPQEYAQKVLNACKKGYLVTIPQSEQAKSLDTMSVIFTELHKHNFTRRDAMAAVGGGMVTDLCGFASACYMRGIDCYLVPTTLLSQVDSSAGGKTAVNFAGVKNLIGAFHNPAKVLVDPDTLASLSPALYGEGMAEIIKIAACLDAGLFAKLEQDADIEEIITDALRLKLMVVQQDPYEKGLRKVLNFGHTVGHAIEALSGCYHGEAVAMGMMYMSTGEAQKRIRSLLEKYNLPVYGNFPREELLGLIAHDKKSCCDGAIDTVRVDEIGKVYFRRMKIDDLL